MSLILDALRKMEQDRNSRRGAAQDIRPEVLRYRAAAKPQLARPYLPAVVGLVLLACGLGAGYLLMGNRTARAPEQAAPAASQVTKVTPAAPMAPAVQIAPLVEVAPVVPAPAAPLTQPTVAPAVSERPAKPHPARPPAAASLPVRPEEPAGRSREKPAHREAAAAPQAAPADISITGIAWQDERSLRRAVVNGALVGEGTEVAGARVVEIREDRVRLSRGGQLFDAVFSAGFSR